MDLEKLAGVSGPSHTADSLRVLGKQAAAHFLRKEASNLTTAVQQIVQEDGRLNRDQVERIVEFANQATWEELFHKQGQRTAEFPTADATEVLKGLEIEPSQTRGMNTDYDQPPAQTVDFSAIEKMFGVAPPEPPSISTTPAESMFHKVASGEKELKAALAQAESLESTLREEVYQLVKQAHFQDDLGMVETAKALTKVASVPFVRRTMVEIADRFHREGKRTDLEAERMKLARVMVINDQHPLITKMAALEQTELAVARCRRGVEQFVQARRQVLDHLASR